MLFLNRYFLIGFKELISIVAEISKHFYLCITSKPCDPWILVIPILIILFYSYVLNFEVLIYWWTDGIII